MNLDTIVSFTGGTGRNQLLSQTLAATTETEIKVGTDAGSAIAVLQLPQQTDILGSGAPQDPNLNAAILGNRGLYDGRTVVGGRPLFTSTSFAKGQPFLVRCAGVVTPASNGANTFTFILYSGTTKGGTAIATTGALTGTQTSTQAGAFILESQCIWDSVGQILYGQFWYALAAGATPSYHVWAVNSSTATVTAIASMKFCCSVTWGNAAGGTCALSEFSISQR